MRVSEVCPLPVPTADGMRNWALVHRSETGRRSLVTLDRVTSTQPKQGLGTCWLRDGDAILFDGSLFLCPDVLCEAVL